MLQITAIPAYADNYIWAFYDSDDFAIWVVDPGEAAPVREWLKRNNKKLAGILVTHHHWDHVDGIAGLTDNNTPVYGPAIAALPTTTVALREGDEFDAGPLRLKVMELPGHTQHHVAYLASPAAAAPILFCGDILFSAGCGRLKDGTPDQMHKTFARLAELPPLTQVYCGHEYTLDNLRFSLNLDPDNAKAIEYRDYCRDLRDKNQPTLPSTIQQERLINPFFRTQSEQILDACERHFGIRPQSSLECFAALRKWKDSFV